MDDRSRVFDWMVRPSTVVQRRTVRTAALLQRSVRGTPRPGRPSNTTGHDGWFSNLHVLLSQAHSLRAHTGHYLLVWSECGFLERTVRKPQGSLDLGLRRRPGILVLF